MTEQAVKKEILKRLYAAESELQRLEDYNSHYSSSAREMDHLNALFHQVLNEN